MISLQLNGIFSLANMSRLNSNRAARPVRLQAL